MVVSVPQKIPRYRRFDPQVLREKAELAAGVTYAVAEDFPTYDVGTNGDVRRNDKTPVGPHFEPAGTLVPARWTTKGFSRVGTPAKKYCMIKVNNKDGKEIHMGLQILVLLAHRGKRPTGCQAGHFVIGDTRVNCLWNLRWRTTEQQQEDKIYHGTRRTGDKNRLTKVKNRDVRYIRRNACVRTSKVLRNLMAARLNVKPQTIKNIADGKSRNYAHMLPKELSCPTS